MTTTATPTVSTTTATTTTSPRRRSAPRTLLLIIGAFLVFVGANALMGAALVQAFDSRHDGDGFFTAQPGRFSTGTHAITSASLDLSAAGPDEIYAQELLGRLRISVDSTTASPIFVGIARTDDVEAYLGGVAHEEVDETELGLFGVVYSSKPGGAPAAAPTAQPFWVASAAGQGRQTVTWSVQPGDWTVVVMNADGSAGVSANGTGGITLPVVHTVITVLYVTSGVFLLAGLTTMLAARAGRRREIA
jgi:hypothetical protein